MPVDSFKFLPRLIEVFYTSTEAPPQGPIPWTPLDKPLEQAVFGLVTSGGLYRRDLQPPFDLEREQAEPTWGDPTYRTIPADSRPEQVSISHLHVNPADADADFNILMPIQRFQELAAEGRIGGLAREHYAFMGYQGFPPNPEAWRTTYAPQVAEKFKAQGVDCVLLTPS